MAGFLKSEIASVTVRQAVRCHHQQKQNKAHMGQPAPTNGIILISNKLSLSELTVVSDPTKRRKPNPTLFVDCCVPYHHCPPLLFIYRCCPHLCRPCRACCHPCCCHHCLIIDRAHHQPVITTSPVPALLMGCRHAPSCPKPFTGVEEHCLAGSLQG
jgi:hypothetical protein